MMIKPTRDTNYAVHSMSFNETFTEKDSSVLSDIDLEDIDLDADVEPFDMLELVIDIDE